MKKRSQVINSTWDTCKFWGSNVGQSGRNSRSIINNDRDKERYGERLSPVTEWKGHEQSIITFMVGTGTQTWHVGPLFPWPIVNQRIYQFNSKYLSHLLFQPYPYKYSKQESSRIFQTTSIKIESCETQTHLQYNFCIQVSLSLQKRE